MTTIFDRMKSPEGRLSQQGYLIGFVAPFVAITALSWAAFTGMLGPNSALALQACALGWTFLLAFGDALNIKRYHDLGNSGRLYRLCRPGLVVLPLLAFALNFLIPAQMASMGDISALAFMIRQDFAPSIGPVPMALLGLTFVGVAANLAYLSMMPGQAGPNDHGPDPRGGSAPIPGASQAASATRDSESDPVKRALAEYNKQRNAPPAQATRAAAPAGRASPITPAAAPGVFGKKRR